MSWWLVAMGLGAYLLTRDGAEPAGAPAGPVPSAGPFPGPSPTPGPKVPVIRGIATGHTSVIGDSLGVGLAPALRKLLGSVDGAAINGTRIDTWEELGKRQNIGGNAPVVLVSLGTNDIASGVMPPRVRALVPHLVHEVRMGNSKVGWIGPPTLPWAGTELRAALASELASQNVPLFDSTRIAFERAPDRIHATAAGYATWAQAIAAWLPTVGLR